MTAPLASYRSEFPSADTYVYLDHAGVAPVSLRVTDAIERYARESAEGGAFHYPAWSLRVAEARRACARLLNADAAEVAFVRSTSHGLSLVSSGLDWRPGDNVLFHDRDFPSNIYPWTALERKAVEPRPFPSRNGRISIEDIERRIDGRTRLLSISSVQFASGFRIGLERLGSLCRARGILFCVDAIQSLGVVPTDVRSANIDFLSADAHKWLLGPEGIGMFYCRQGLAERLFPPLLGWKSVERDLDFERPGLTLKTDALRFEEGSMNLAGIFGLGAAAQLLLEAGIANIEQAVLGLGDLLVQEAARRGWEVLTPTDRKERAGIVVFRGPFDPAAARDALRQEGIMVNVRGGGLRVSPHFYTNGQDIARLFEALDRFTR